MAWRLQSAPVSTENLVTSGTQVGCSDPDRTSRLQNAAYFVQTGSRIMHVLNRMAHGYRGKAGIGGAEVRQASHGNRQAHCPTGRCRIGIRIHSFAIPTQDACCLDEGPVTAANVEKTGPLTLEPQMPGHQIPLEL